MLNYRVSCRKSTYTFMCGQQNVYGMGVVSHVYIQVSPTRAHHSPHSHGCELPPPHILQHESLECKEVECLVSQVSIPCFHWYQALVLWLMYHWSVWFHSCIKTIWKWFHIFICVFKWLESIPQTMAIHKAFQLVVLEPRTTIRMKLLGIYIKIPIPLDGCYGGALDWRLLPFYWNTLINVLIRCQLVRI